MVPSKIRLLLPLYKYKNKDKNKNKNKNKNKYKYKDKDKDKGSTIPMITLRVPRVMVVQCSTQFAFICTFVGVRVRVRRVRGDRVEVWAW